MVRSLHHDLLTLDAHLDAPVHFTRADWSFGERHDPANEIAQVDLGRMEGGNLSGGFFVVYTTQGPLTPDGYAAARAHAARRSGEIDAMVARFSGRIGAAATADEVEVLHREGRLIALKSVENSYPVGEDLSLLAEWRRRGVRLAGAVHQRANQLADSATDIPRWQGLSPLGRRWVAEMNRCGIVIDPSHASDAAFDEMLDLSDTPLLLSHSGARATFDHPRNLDDERLRRLARAGGVLCFTTIYLSAMNAGPERRSLLARLGGIGSLSPVEQTELAADWRTLDRTVPMWAADLDDYMAALLRVIDLIGVEHVAFGADFDGGGGVAGLDDVTALPRITERLEDAGLSADEILSMWSGNVMRVMRVAEGVAAPDNPDDPHGAPR